MGEDTIHRNLRATFPASLTGSRIGRGGSTDGFGEGSNITSTARKPRIGVVSPFLDKSHGTERMVVEWITRLAENFEFHIYSQSVQDVDLSQVVWHRIPKLPGPHLFNYLWWFAANHVIRLWDVRVRRIRYDLLYSPGVNCLDADVVSVHIVFAELLRQVGPQLKLRNNPVRFWPVLLHRRIYYRLIIALESRVFTNTHTQLVLTSPRTPNELERFYSQRQRFPIVCAGVDHDIFNPNRREELRTKARAFLSLHEDEFVLLLIGNDWRKKGLEIVLDALAKMPDLPLRLLAVGDETSTASPWAVTADLLGRRVSFLPPRADVEIYYAAADVYTGPSLEDTFALPAAEAMACGLPVIMSARAGVSNFITNGLDGFLLEDPTDPDSVVSLIRRLYEDRDLRNRVGARAVETAQRFSWELGARRIGLIFEEAIRRKNRPPARTSDP